MSHALSARALAAVLFTINLMVAHAGQIRLETGVIDTTLQVPLSDMASTAHSSSESVSVIVQFAGPMQPKWRQAAEKTGATLRTYLPEHAYLTRVPMDRLADLLDAAGVIWVGQLPAPLKIHGEVVAALNQGDAPEIDITILSLDDAPVHWLARMGLDAESRSTSMGWHDTRVRVPGAMLASLARMDSVFRIEPQSTYELSGERGAQTVAGNVTLAAKGPDGPGYAAWLQQHGLQGGPGLIAQVQDDGLDQGIATNEPGTAHPDLLGRIAGVFNASSDPTGASRAGHGQINAGIIMGNAAVGTTDADGFLLGQGVAPQASVYATKIFRDDGVYSLGNHTLQQLAADAWAAGARFSNNSWGARTFGGYFSDSATFDALTRDVDPTTPGDQPMTFFFSTANYGPGAMTIASPASAKNVIAVGAMENNDADGTDGCLIGPTQSDNVRDLTVFSSRGPAADGRIGVTVTSVGTHVQGPASTVAGYDGTGVCDQYWPAGQTDYARSSGTSHSAPLVTGAGMIVHEFFQTQLAPLGHTDNPSPAMLRAVLTNTAADPVGGSDGTGGVLPHVPNPMVGWGSVSLGPLVADPQALYSFDQDHLFTASGQVWEVLLTPVDVSRPMKITLTWTDAPATPGANPTLVNDLDLEVVGQETYQGNVFHEGYSVVGGAPDRLNNIEAVYIEQPGGAYLVRVLAHNIAADGVPSAGVGMSQDFALFASNATGQSSLGFVHLDRGRYRCDDIVELLLSDADLQGALQAAVTLTSDSGDVETVTLTETPASSGVFVGSVPLAASAVVAQDGTLQAAHDDEIVATYHDADDGSGQPAVSQALAMVDCVAPQVVQVDVTSVSARGATLTVETDKPARVQARYGTQCGAPLNTQTSPALSTLHTITLSGLQEETEYFVALDIVDGAGNETFDDNQGACYAVATLPLTDYFTQWFSTTPFDLQFQTLTFTPDGSPSYYGVCREEATRFPTDPSTGVTLPLGDDASFPVTLTGGAQVWLYGQSYSTVYVGSNGYLTFTQSDTRITGSYQAHFLMPRISGLFLDLNPFAAGRVSWAQLADRAVFTFEDVPLFGTANRNNFQIEMYFDGRITLTHLRVDVFGGLVGLSSGGGVPAEFEPSNLSGYGPCIGQAGQILFDRAAFSCEGTLGVELRDLDLAGQGTAQVTLTTQNGDEEVLTVLESDIHPGIFLGSMAMLVSAPVPGNGVLEIASDDRVTARYFDEDDGGGSSAWVQESVDVDCEPPVIHDVTVEQIGARAAVIRFRTNEPTLAQVRYGVACGAPSHVAPFGQIPRLEHVVSLTGLERRTRYYFSILAEDQAGNTALEDNGGLCFHFTTLYKNDYFTEMFAALNNDMAYSSVTFTPNGSPDFYRACTVPATEFPVDPQGGTVLLLGDDASVQVNLNGDKVWLYGAGYGSFFVGSNGYLTFIMGDTSPTESYVAHFNQPRVSGLFDDLDPSVGGVISWKQLDDRVAVTFEDVPEYNTVNASSFQMEMFFNGVIRLTWLGLSVSDGLVGLSRGTGVPVDFEVSDLSSYPSDCGPAAGPVYLVPCGCAKPLRPSDSDGDRVLNGNEFDPRVTPNELGRSNRFLYDSDGDGLHDGHEDLNRNGIRDFGETSTRNRDSDADGVWDGVEVLLLGTDPLDPFDPVVVIDLDQDGLPASIDPDDTQADIDGDRFTDGYEAATCGLDAVWDAASRPALGDLDCDGLVTNLDALIAQSLFMEVVDPADYAGTVNADVNRDGVVTNLDALILYGWVTGQVPLLPWPMK